jgi:hypothetical protein
MATINFDSPSLHRLAWLRTSAGLTWIVLVAASVGSWWVGTDHGLNDQTAAAALLLAVAIGKVYLVGMQFMELRHTDLRLLRAFQGYCGLLGVGLLGLVLFL